MKKFDNKYIIMRFYLFWKCSIDPTVGGRRIFRIIDAYFYCFNVYFYCFKEISHLNSLNIRKSVIH